jgi:hypothetical protein
MGHRWTPIEENKNEDRRWTMEVDAGIWRAPPSSIFHRRVRGPLRPPSYEVFPGSLETLFEDLTAYAATRKRA